MTTAINPKGSRVYDPGTTSLDWVTSYLLSSVGNKIIVAVTGLSLVTFVVFHMIGNLKMFSGQESINKYAHFLKHDLGVLIWIARAGLLGLFGTHVLLTLRLRLKTASARPISYVKMQSAQATPQSKAMLSTGLTIGAFTVFHLAHYSFLWIQDFPFGLDVNGNPDVYSMVVFGFSTPWISVIYLLTQLVLFLHLTHGIQSSLQTLGLVGRRFTPAAKIAGYLIASIVLGGNVAIIVAIWTGWIPPASTWNDY